jgi:voltage-gated potassium channel
MDSGLRKEFDVIAVAVKKASGTMVFNPKPTEILEAGDLLVIIGMKDDLDRLNAIL